MKSSPTLLAAAVLLLGASCAAGLYVPISVDGDFSDWDSVPALDTDAADNVGGVDFAVTKVANDDNFLYIYNSFHTANSMPVYLSVDSDGDVGTGFDIFGLRLVGADASWQNDFPFTSGDGVFNNGLGMSGDLYGTGAAAVTPFAVATSERELAISLDILFNEDGSAVFGAESFALLMWTDDGSSGDVSAAITYSLATIPEPTPLLFGAAICLGKSLSGRRRSTDAEQGVES